MIQSILFFLFGFLGAILLALMLAPALWRRAEKLTRKQLEATLPLSLNEIQADKDLLRAESAMAIRSLEISGAEMRDRNNHLMLEISHQREELRKVSEESLQARENNMKLTAERDDLREKLARREAEVEKLGEETRDLDAMLAKLRTEHGELNGQYSEALLTASNRQVELVARGADIEKLGHELGALRVKRAEIEARAKEANAAMRSTAEALRLEARKNADLQKRHDKTIAALAERDVQAGRRDSELARIKSELRDAAREKASARKALSELERARKRQDTSGGAAYKAPAAEPPENLVGDALLREQIHDLAARVVVMTAALEGNALGSLATADKPAKGAPLSLADRVRRLQTKSGKA